jgi:hypothetical protein
MNKHWFTCVVKYSKNGVDGTEDKTTEQFLLDAYTYTEAEARLVGIVTEYCAGPFDVKQITKSNFTEVVRFDEGDRWFRIKVALTSFDEKTDKEKEHNQFFLFNADDLRDAYDKTGEFMKSAGVGYVIPAINFTKISEVYPLSEEGGVNVVASDGYGINAEGHPGLAPAGVNNETGEVA